MEKKDKHGAPLVIGFAEFENAYQAHAALKTLQAGLPGYDCCVECHLLIVLCRCLCHKRNESAL